MSSFGISWCGCGTDAFMFFCATKDAYETLPSQTSSTGYGQGDGDVEMVSPSAPSVAESGVGSEPVSSPASSLWPSRQKRHVCTVENCTKSFSRPARLMEHLRSHTNERLFQCEHEGCGKSYLRQSHLNHHVKSAHTKIRDYVCPKDGCGMSFATGTRLRRHISTHEGKEKFKCTGYPGCEETFRKHATLQRHITSVHLGLRPFPCQEAGCSAAFDTAGHLRSHVAKMHGEARFTCTECIAAASTLVPAATSEFDEGVDDELFPIFGADIGADIDEPEYATFQTYAELQDHMRLVHPPGCTLCGQVFASSREMRRHVDLNHPEISAVSDNQPQYPCPYSSCPRTFNKKGNLNVHIRAVHEGEKRFVCGETDLSNSRKAPGWDGSGACGQRYGSRSALEEHVRTAHLGLLNTKAEKRAAGRSRNANATMNANMDVNMNMNMNMDIAAETAAYGETSANTPSRDLMSLTGLNYETSGRDYACLVGGCSYRFHRDYDLFQHLTGSAHQLGDSEVQLLLLQRPCVA